jgi:hypothetical protein
MIDALRQKKGMVYLTARALGCEPTTIYDRAKVIEAVKDCIDYETGLVLDVAEMKLYEGILAGESWAIVFCLNRKGRHRGYGDKAGIEHKGETFLDLVHQIVTSRADITPYENADPP